MFVEIPELPPQESVIHKLPAEETPHTEPTE